MPGHASTSRKILIVRDKVGLKHCPHISISSEICQKASAHEYWLEAASQANCQKWQLTSLISDREYWSFQCHDALSLKDIW